MKLNAQERFEWIGALIMLGAGLFCLFFPMVMADGLMITASILCTASALVIFIQAARRRNFIEALKGVAAAILATLFWCYRAEGLQFIDTVFGWYMIATGTILMVEGVMDLKEHSKTGWAFIILAFGQVVLGMIGLLSARKDPRMIQLLIGGYLVYQGLQLIVELYVFRHHSGSRTWSFRYWSALPVYLVAAGPSLILRIKEKKKMSQETFPFDQSKNDKPVNLRVFIHTGLSGDHQFGHMTFSYNGIMYSYGNYDAAEEKLFRTFGPGILFTAPMKIYVNNCCLYEDSTLFEFGIHLSPEQEQKLKDILETICSETYRWYSPISRAKYSQENFEKLQSDYASRLHWRTGSKFYKFRHGIWKTYWVLGSNCSLFVSRILHDLDSNYVIPRGINTPGEFYEYYVTAYQDPNSEVVYRSWHTKEVPETLFDAAA